MAYRWWLAGIVTGGAAVMALAQPPGGFGGFGGPRGGRGGPGGGFSERTEILKQYDKDGDGKLNKEERAAALAGIGNGGGGRRGFGRRGFGGPGGNSDQEPVRQGPKLTPADVKQYGSEPLYDPNVLRTVFLDFEDANWEAELMAFWHTDVEVPAKMTVDGKIIKEVAVHFRGSSSFMMVPAGRKHSINIDVDYGDKQQRLLGYKSLELLNSNGDPTFMRAVLYDQMAQKYLVAPKANFMRIVINGENWGIYQNTQAFNADLIQDNFQTKKGNRWKVPGNPGAQAGLAYIGDDVAAYRNHYEIKTKDDPKAWADLIHLTKVLSQTPPDQLEKALEPILDVDGALKFLAMDKATINTDGFWVRMSDYSIYEDEKGKFHIIPHDANETFREPEGGGRSGVREPDNAELDPFAGADDSRKALLNRLVAVPALRVKYLTYLRDIARDSFDWTKMEPVVKRYEAMIAPDVKADGHKLFPADMFRVGLYEENPNSFGGPTGAPRLGLKPFFEQRRAYLLNYPEIRKLPN